MERTMTKATTKSTPSRRGVLAGTTAALLGAVSLASARPTATDEGQDSALLMACAEFHRTHADLQEWYATGAKLEPFPRETEAHRLWKAEDNRFFYANFHAFEAVDDMPAKTHAGVIAKLKVLSEYMRDQVKDGSATIEETFAYTVDQEA